MKRSKPIQRRGGKGRRRRAGCRLAVAWKDARPFAVPIPKDEPERLQNLKSYRVLDTPPEEGLDQLTRLAAEVCGAPIALVSLIDEERQWFKSRVGLGVTQTPREHAFCAHAIMAPRLFVVPDASKDRRFASNPLVTASPRIRFYAGAPLISPEEHTLGTLCVIDRVPRKLDRKQTAVLGLLSQQVMAQLVMRRTILELREALGERERLDRQMQKTLRRLEQGAGTRTRLLSTLNRDLQEVATSIGAAADRMASGAIAGRQRRQIESLRLLARTLAGRCAEIVRVSRIGFSSGTPLG